MFDIMRCHNCYKERKIFIVTDIPPLLHGVENGKCWSQVVTQRVEGRKLLSRCFPGFSRRGGMEGISGVRELHCSYIVQGEEICRYLS